MIGRNRARGLTRRQLASRAALGTAALAVGIPADRALADAAMPKPPLLGSDKATKRFVCWGTYTCPFTAQLFQMLLGIVRENPGFAAVEWRHFPTHPVDPALHVAALAFEGDNFWKFSFAMMALVLKNGGMYDQLTPAKLIEFAEAAGGSEEILNKAYADDAKWTAVNQDMLAGRLMGVSLTPGLFFNGYFLRPEGIPNDKAAFDQSLRAMLKVG